LIIPSAIPFIIAGVRLAIGRGLVGMIVAEFYTSVTGLGYMIVRYANALETDKLFVPIVVVMLLGVGLMSLAKWIEQRIAPWRNAIEKD
jgi:NitT/TauT family transport system permease protein